VCENVTIAKLSKRAKKVAKVPSPEAKVPSPQRTVTGGKGTVTATYRHRKQTYRHRPRFRYLSLSPGFGPFLTAPRLPFLLSVPFPLTHQPQFRCYSRPRRRFPYRIRYLFSLLGVGTFLFLFSFVRSRFRSQSRLTPQFSYFVRSLSFRLFSRHSSHCPSYTIPRFTRASVSDHIRYHRLLALVVSISSREFSPYSSHCISNTHTHTHTHTHTLNSKSLHSTSLQQSVAISNNSHKFWIIRTNFQQFSIIRTNSQ